MTRRQSLQTIHEPFGDAYYYGPERMGSRFETDEKARAESGFSDSTFRTIMDRIEQEAAEVGRSTFSPVASSIEVLPIAHFIACVSFHRQGTVFLRAGGRNAWWTWGRRLKMSAKHQHHPSPIPSSQHQSKLLKQMIVAANIPPGQACLYQRHHLLPRSTEPAGFSHRSVSCQN